MLCMIECAMLAILVWSVKTHQLMQLLVETWVRGELPVFTLFLVKHTVLLFVSSPSHMMDVPILSDLVPYCFLWLLRIWWDLCPSLILLFFPCLSWTPHSSSLVLPFFLISWFFFLPFSELSTTFLASLRSPFKTANSAESVGEHARYQVSSASFPFNSHQWCTSSLVTLSCLRGIWHSIP